MAGGASGSWDKAEAPGLAVVVASFPRSGTHLTLDFLRRNFPVFNIRLMPWESSECLFFALDARTPEEEALHGASSSISGAPRGNELWRRATRQANFLVKTHDLPLAGPWLQEKLDAAAADRRVIHFYPFRRFSKTLVSYHSHQRVTFNDNLEMDLLRFVQGEDRFFRKPLTVMECAQRHADWAVECAYPIDFEALVREPAAYAAAIGRVIGLEPEQHADPLPPKRVAHGRLGEILERFRGRQTSEVDIALANQPASILAHLDESGPLADRYARLKAKEHAWLTGTV